MVSIRCKLIVKSELENLGLHNFSVGLGEIDVQEIMTPEQRMQFAEAIKKTGLEVIDDKKTILIERIKNVVIETIHYSDQALKTNFSQYLSEKLNYDYTYMSNLFSETTGTTIEHFIIRHKIERVKELIIYDELTLSEIAHKLHYSSVAHLSHQFKKVTGLTPSYFKKLKDKRLSDLNDI